MQSDLLNARIINSPVKAAQAIVRKPNESIRKQEADSGKEQMVV
jgi:hypothetical protein